MKRSRAADNLTTQGPFRIGHFFISTGPITLGYIVEIKSEEFRLSWIRHFLNSIWSAKNEPPKATPYGQWCSNTMAQRRGILLIYSSLTCKDDIPSYTRAWEMDTGHTWDQSIWSQVFQKASCKTRSYKGILNISLIEANVKLLTIWYYVPSRLATIYPEASPLCFRGCNLVGSMFHIWWTCPRIRSYWNKFFLHIEENNRHYDLSRSHHSSLKITKSWWSPNTFKLWLSSFSWEARLRSRGLGKSLLYHLGQQRVKYPGSKNK